MSTENEGLTPRQAQEQYGATHYATMKDGVTPQLYYRFGTTLTTEGPVACLQYLSHCNLWMGSSRPLDDSTLTPIVTSNK